MFTSVHDSLEQLSHLLAGTRCPGLKLFEEVHHNTVFSLNIYSKKENVQFESISNLFAASTIDECYNNRKGIIQDGCAWNSKDLLKDSLNNKGFRGSVCLFLIRRSLITDNNITFPEGIIHEDNIVVFQLMLFADKCQYIAKPYFKRRVRSGSTMTNSFSKRNIDGYLRVAQMAKQMEKSFPQWNELIELYLHKNLDSVIWLAHRLKPAEKAETLKLFFKHRLVKYASLRNWCVFFVKKD